MIVGIQMKCVDIMSGGSSLSENLELNILIKWPRALTYVSIFTSNEFSFVLNTIVNSSDYLIKHDNQFSC